MAEKGCLKRLQKEYHALCKVRHPVRFGWADGIDWGWMLRRFLDVWWFGSGFVGLQEPPPQIVARPLPNDILEWRKWPLLLTACSRRFFARWVVHARIDLCDWAWFLFELMVRV
jgi:hypothetical protein